MSSADIILGSAHGDLHGGDRCPKCHRRVPKPKRDSSPSELARFQATGPRDRVLALRELADMLQEYTLVDPHSYPMLTLLEGVVLLGAQQREELRAHFGGRVEL